MPKGKPPSFSKPKSKSFAQRQPKPCPQCYAPMIPMGGDVFECRKHGKPTRP